jgi:hypothetical protein
MYHSAAGDVSLNAQQDVPFYKRSVRLNERNPSRSPTPLARHSERKRRIPFLFNKTIKPFSFFVFELQNI